jgi:hypothetical protein
VIDLRTEEAIEHRKVYVGIYIIVSLLESGGLRENSERQSMKESMKENIENDLQPLIQT